MLYAAKYVLKKMCFIQCAHVHLTGAQMKTLATPIELVEAPGDNQLLIPSSVALSFEAGSEVLVVNHATDAFQVCFETSGEEAANKCLLTNFVDGATDKVATMEVEDLGPLDVGDVVNKALMFKNTGINLTGNASDDAELCVHIVYSVHNFD